MNRCSPRLWSLLSCPPMCSPSTSTASHTTRSAGATVRRDSRRASSVCLPSMRHQFRVLDTYKGSYYNNPQYDVPSTDPEAIARAPEVLSPNIWPTEHIPGFEKAFKVLLWPNSLSQCSTIGPRIVCLRGWPEARRPCGPLRSVCASYLQAPAI